MAEKDESPLSLMSLEDDLTCCICLSPFNCPVTIPCGHNFCQGCILSTWKGPNYSCPQCRTVFTTKPELKKNTVLSTVVETFTLRSTKCEVKPVVEEIEVEERDVILCDTCMKAEASQTCLTCMASFCEEHLQSHRESPIFRQHQLTEPVGDLSERICLDHHKLMEFFCSQHGRPICSTCLQQVHKGCPFLTFEDQRIRKESDLRSKLDLLDRKIVKNEDVISQTNDMQNKLKDSATKRKKDLEAEYQQLRDMLARDEYDALNAVDRELESGQTKVKDLVKKFTENINNMTKAKEDIHSLLSQSQTLAFLQASFDLPAAANFDPYTPRMDSRKVPATQAFVAAMKEHLTEIFKQPMESRPRKLKPGEHADERTPVPGSTGSRPESEVLEPQKQNRMPRFHNHGRPPIRPAIQTVPSMAHGGWNPSQFAQEPQRAPRQPRYPGPTYPGSQSKGPVMKSQKTSDIPSDITAAENRSELLKYATELTLDPKTVHKGITLSEDFAKATVSDEDLNYPDTPERFEVSSQVLASKSFSRGRHYWEVQLSSNNFIGIGLAYSSIDRKGRISRLGRNAQSLCVEWFNGKLSAWYNNSETVLYNPNPKCVGVLLDCEEGTATFYNVADRAYPLHSFVFPFSEAVYPAFWIVLKNTFITLSTTAAHHPSPSV